MARRSRAFFHRDGRSYLFQSSQVCVPKTVDYPEEWSNGYHVMLDTEELVTVRWDQVEAAPERTRYYSFTKLLGSFTPSGRLDTSLLSHSVERLSMQIR